MDSVDQLQMLHEAVKLWVILDRIEKQTNIPEFNSEECNQLMQFRALIYPQHCHNVCLADHLRGAAQHMQRYLNCDSATVLSECTYADLWKLVARVENLDSFHLEQLDNSSLEDGEILNAVKVEPCSSDDEDTHNCKHASVGRRRKRFFTSSLPRDSSQRDGLRIASDCFDSATDARLQSCSHEASPLTRNVKQTRQSKHSRSHGQPGRPRVSPVWSFFDYIPENNESICKIDTDIGLCGAVLKGKNSTNLKKHVECFHPEVYGLCVTSDALTGGGNLTVLRRRCSENVGRRRGSPVWEHFEYLADSDMSICKVSSATGGGGGHCATMLKGKNPTNLKKHLQAHHDQVYDQYWNADGSLRTRWNGGAGATD